MSSINWLDGFNDETSNWHEPPETYSDDLDRQGAPKGKPCFIASEIILSIVLASILLCVVSDAYCAQDTLSNVSVGQVMQLSEASQLP
jgi:hypothetical protein